MTDIHIVGFLTLWPSTGENPRDYANGYHGLLRLVTAIRSGDEPGDAARWRETEEQSAMSARRGFVRGLSESDQG